VTRIDSPLQSPCRVAAATQIPKLLSRLYLGKNIGAYRLSDVQKFAQFRDVVGRSAFKARNEFEWCSRSLHTSLKAALFSIAAQTVSRANPFTTLHLSLLLTNVQICNTVARVISNKPATKQHP